MGYFSRLFRALFNIKPKKKSGTSFIDDLTDDTTTLDDLDLTDGERKELIDYLNSLDVMKIDSIGNEVENLATKICKDIILNPVDWTKDRYHFSNKGKGFEFWISNGRSYFRCEHPSDIEFDNEDLENIWQAYDKWAVVRNAKRQSELANKF